MAGKPTKCVEPAGGPVVAERSSEKPITTQEKEAKTMTARVGGPAPDFEAGAYFNGQFQNIKLSDYKGKWVALCFYPGDFTFV